MNKNFLCKKRIDFDKIIIYNMRIFKNKTQNNKNKENSTAKAVSMSAQDERENDGYGHIHRTPERDLKM